MFYTTFAREKMGQNASGQLYIMDPGQMFSLEEIFIDALWIIGIAGVLATLSYMGWYRSANGLTWRRLFSLPRILIPLCVSMEIFCIGIAVNGVLAQPPAPWWETVAWSALVVLFAVQTVAYGIAGARNGWDTPLEERDDDERSKYGG